MITIITMILLLTYYHNNDKSRLKSSSINFKFQDRVRYKVQNPKN